MLPILNIKWFYFVETQQKHSIINSLVRLHVSVFARPSSGQHFPVEDTIGVHTCKTCPKHVEFYSKNKFEKLMHFIGFITRMFSEPSLGCFRYHLPSHKRCVLTLCCDQPCNCLLQGLARQKPALTLRWGQSYCTA